MRLRCGRRVGSSALLLLATPLLLASPLHATESAGAQLDTPLRASLMESFDAAYDETHAGWGTGRKYLDGAALELSYVQLDNGDQTAVHKIRRTLDANQTLIDPVWGGVFAFAAHSDWSAPDFAKPLASQAADLQQYALAYARWQRPADLAAARLIYAYLQRFLSAPDGGFYEGQQASVSATVSGARFYAQGEVGRRALGMPAIDQREYAAGAGRAIAALCSYYDMTGAADALARAARAAQWAQLQRAAPAGGFGHSSSSEGPFPADSVAMAAAYVALYRSTGERPYLQSAARVLQFIDLRFRDSRAPDVSDQALLARTANMVSYYTGVAQYRQMAQHALRFLRAVAARAPRSYQPDILLADDELAHPPVHLTVVGGKSDPAAQALHAAALRFPAEYLQVEWWDRTEGALPDPSINYPQLPRAAAFACTANACSTPVYDPGQLQERVRALAQ